MTHLIWSNLDTRAVDTARILSADAVENAGNGHPGTAISLAPAAYLLFQKVLRHDPKDPTWLGRDRFILSAGHTSLTQYIQLYFSGYGLELEDIKALRTEGSRTPGHPEYGHTPGVEITTGPLGQGISSAVGFAYASRFERGLFDPDAAPGESPFDHFVYVIAGDGDLQEGVSAEASALAGHQCLGNLVVIYDSNQISIEDDTTVAFTEDVQKRYEAYDWDVQVVDWKKTGKYNEDIEALYEAINRAKAETRKPSLIILKTIIGWPAPTKQNTGKIHGSALGADELAGLKKALDFNPERKFDVAQEIIDHTREVCLRAKTQKQHWQQSFERWQSANPDKNALLERLLRGELPPHLEDALPAFEPGTQISTRAASGKVINALAKVTPELWGGSADLAESNNTTILNTSSFLPPEHSTRQWSGDPYGRVLHFGIREHAMGAILNGIVLHGPTRAFGGTFLVFSDYMRPAVRLAALMRIPSIFVWTHDSVALGEDGPTHQPIEHLTSLRAIPHLDVIRPADANETAYAWKTILERKKNPAGLALSRQNLPVLERSKGEADGEHLACACFTERGAYILAQTPNNEDPDVLLIATGAEVHIALEARTLLQQEGISARVISAICLEWFEEQSEEYRQQVLPKHIKARVSVEAGLALTWHRYIGEQGQAISVEDFGASTKGEVLLERLGVTAANVVEAAKLSIAQCEQS